MRSRALRSAPSARQRAPAVAGALGLGLLSAGDASVWVASALPASAIVANRAIGFGVPEPATRGTMPAIAGALRVADALGLSGVLTFTGEAVAGDPRHSCDTILRCGFRKRHVKEDRAPPRR